MGVGAPVGAGEPGEPGETVGIGAGPLPPHSVDSACEAHHAGGGVNDGAGDGLQSGGAFAGQHWPA